MPDQPTALSRQGRNRVRLSDLPATQLTELAQLFIDTKEGAGRRPRTLDAMDETLAKFVRLVHPPSDPAELSSDHIVRFLARLRRQGMKPASINHHQRGLNGFIRWLYRRRAIEWDLSYEVDLVEVPSEQRPTVTPDVVTRLLTMAVAAPAKKGSNPNVQRNVLILRLLYDTGLRRGEVLALRYEDIDLRNDVLRVRGEDAKDHDWRAVPFSPATRAAFREYNLVRGPLLAGCNRPLDGPYFRCDDGHPMTASAIRHTLRRLADAAGVEVTPHAFRRGSAARMRAAGMDVLHVMTVMGWEGPQMVKRYTQDTEKEAAIGAWREKFGS